LWFQADERAAERSEVEGRDRADLAVPPLRGPAPRCADSLSCRCQRGPDDDAFGTRPETLAVFCSWERRCQAISSGILDCVGAIRESLPADERRGAHRGGEMRSD